MTGPIPYGLHVLSGELTEKDMDRILSAIHRFLTYKEAAQLENLKQVYNLPDGGYFIVQHVGGLFRVIADKQEPEKFKFINDGLVKMFIPMFFSGVIEKAILRDDERVRIKLTNQCRQRLSRQLGYDIPKEVSLDRFTIDQSLKFFEFIPENQTFRRTQYSAHNPGWYSGSMTKVHQFVGGYGIHDFDSLPDDELEKIQLKLPDGLLTELFDKYHSVRLPGYAGLPVNNGQFQYDYKWSKTHAVAFDNENKPWLVQVSNKIYAMPLPVIPLTADPEFHKYVMEELGDSELIEVLNTFGAFPSGESFPNDQTEFRQWIRAGVIIEICDNAEFYSHQELFMACGWSFNNRGNAAYNTAWKYDDKGIIECSTFRLSLNLFASQHHYGVSEVQTNTLNAADRERLSNYLSKLFNALPESHSLSKTIRFKFRRIQQSVILARSSSHFDAEIEINYWDNYVCEPIAVHTGRVHKLYSGKLFHHAKPKAQPQIKFPNYMTGLCTSFDFSPHEDAEFGVTAECDTIMYIYYDNDFVKVVKYFYTTKEFNKQVDTDFEECMTVGSWYNTEYRGQGTISGNFYLTDIDDRTEITGSIIETTVKGQNKGYDSRPFFSFTSVFSRIGQMWRNRYYTHLTKRLETVGKVVTSSVLIPMYNRNTVIHAKKDAAERKIYDESLQLLSVRDPYSYWYWTNHPVWAWMYSLSKETGLPRPSNGNPVWVELEDYSPTACSDFADNGPWVPGMPADYSWLIHPKSDEWMTNGGGGAPPVQVYNTHQDTPGQVTGNLKWVINNRVVTAHNNVPESPYFNPSPDEFGNGIVRFSSKVFLGQSEYANMSETNKEGYLVYTGYSQLVNHSRTYHFIGVINE